MFEGVKALHWKSFRIGLITPLVLTLIIILAGIAWSFFKHDDLTLFEHLKAGIEAVFYYYLIAMFFGPILGYFFIAPYRAGEKLKRIEKNIMHGCGYLISAVTIFLLFMNFVDP